MVIFTCICAYEKEADIMLAEIRGLLKTVFETQNEEIFTHHLLAKGVKDYNIEILWSFYQLLMRTTYVPEMIKMILRPGMSYEKTSDILNIPVGTINSRVYRFSAKLNDEWGTKLIERLMKDRITDHERRIYLIQLEELHGCFRNTLIDPCDLFAVNFLEETLPEAGDISNISSDEFDDLLDVVFELSFYNLKRKYNQLTDTQKRIFIYLLYSATSELSDIDIHRRANLISRCNV
jgi:hypothetical protein